MVTVQTNVHIGNPEVHDFEEPQPRNTGTFFINILFIQFKKRDLDHICTLSHSIFYVYLRHLSYTPGTRSEVYSF